jgi:Zn-dependent peptidase ImmA (M78 family)/transcriptional regulator with XRE-family HTH domain
MNTPAYITPTVLKWARVRSDLSVDELAHKTQVSADRIRQWEEGVARPSFRQAQHVAGALHVPFGYLFLSEPPEEKVPIPDFRRSAGANTKASPNLIDLLNDVLAKQQWYKELVQQAGGSPLPMVGRFTQQEKPNVVAKDIATTLGLEYGSKVPTEEYFKYLASLCEDAGILVMKSGIVGGNPHRTLDPGEFRGFAISDPIAPLVFVNGTDFKAAQVFTLAHELAHVWLGTTGISNERMDDLEQDTPLERLCNAVAAELLVPAEDFEWKTSFDVDTNVQRISARFRVSRFVALRRALDMGAIPKDEFNQQYEKYAAFYKKQEDEQASGGNFFPTLFVRNSNRFTTSVIEAVGEGRALYREAAQLLNVKVPTLKKVADYLESKA